MEECQRSGCEKKQLDPSGAGSGSGWPMYEGCKKPGVWEPVFGGGWVCNCDVGQRPKCGPDVTDWLLVNIEMSRQRFYQLVYSYRKAQYGRYNPALLPGSPNRERMYWGWGASNRQYLGPTPMGLGSREISVNAGPASYFLSVPVPGDPPNPARWFEKYFKIKGGPFDWNELVSYTAESGDEKCPVDCAGVTICNECFTNDVPEDINFAYTAMEFFTPYEADLGIVKASEYTEKATAFVSFKVGYETWNEFAKKGLGIPNTQEGLPEARKRFCEILKRYSNRMSRLNCDPCSIPYKTRRK